VYAPNLGRIEIAKYSTLNITLNVAYKAPFLNIFILFLEIRLLWQTSRPLERPIMGLAHGAPAIDELQILPLRLPYPRKTRKSLFLRIARGPDVRENKKRSRSPRFPRYSYTV